MNYKELGIDYKASSAQQRIWFQSKLVAEVPLYTICIGYRLLGVLSKDALYESLKALLIKHEILRSVFKLKDNELYYQITPIETYPILTCLEHLIGDDEDESDCVRDWIQQETNHQFNFESGPLFYVKLVRFSPEAHLLILCVHHIISDEYSMGLFTKELAGFYNQYMDAAKINFEQLGFNYHDYVRETNEKSKTSLTEQRRLEFKKYFSKAEIMELSFSKTRPSMPSYRGSLHSYTLKGEIVEQLKNFISTNKVTPFIALYSVFVLLLYKYTNKDTIYIGTPIADRMNKKYSEIIGLLINTVIMSSGLNDEMTFGQLLDQVKKGTINLFRMHDVPFDAVVNLIDKKHDPSIHPIFQIMFILRNPQKWSLELSQLELEIFEPKINISKFDITLYAQLHADKLELVFEYAHDLFDKKSIERMAIHYENLLRQALVGVGKELYNFKVISKAEEEVIQNQFSSMKEVPVRDNLWDVFQDCLRNNADTLALISGDKQFTFAELNEQINIMCQRLSWYHLTARQHVVIYVPRNDYLFILILALWRQGISFTPLDKSQPYERVIAIAKDAGAEVIITDNEGSHLLQTSSIKHYNLSEEPTQLGTQIISDYKDIELEDLAYTIYTSGSTGAPKGVEVHRRGLVNILNDMKGLLNIEFGHRWLAATTVTFDISMLEVFFVLLGVTIVFPDEEFIECPKTLASLIDKYQIDLMQTTPSRWKMLLALEQTVPWFIPTILCGGESMDKVLADDLLQRCEALYNCYGPTETTIWSTIAKMEKGAIPTIGKALANTSIFILNDALHLAPIGIPGELYIGGSGLAKGYRNAVELTEQKFIHPALHNQRLYKTGDIAYWDDDGFIHYLYRKDHQVKLNGYRIELGEIETIIRAQKGIVDACVNIADSRKNTARIIAFIIKEGSMQSDVECVVDFDSKEHKFQLNHSVSRYLPKYMVPADYLVANFFPKTSNGKIDREALNSLYQSTLTSLSLVSVSEVVPKDSLEFAIQLIWCELLECDQVDIYSDFFEVGGSSILLASLQAKLEKAFKRSFRIIDLYEYTTIAQQAALISKIA